MHTNLPRLTKTILGLMTLAQLPGPSNTNVNVGTTDYFSKSLTSIVAFIVT